MNKFNEGGNRKFGGDFKKRNFRDRGEGDRGDRGDRGGRGSFGRDRGERPEMFKTICADCGDSCEVPFKPNGNKPVFCSNCFRDKAPSSNFRSERPERSESPRFHSDNQRPSVNPKLEEKLEAMNLKLEKIMKLLTPAIEAVKSFDLHDALEEVEEVVDKAKDKAQTVKKEVKRIERETRPLRKEILKDAKEIKRDVIKGAKKISKTVAKDVKKIKKEATKVVKSVNKGKKK